MLSQWSDRGKLKKTIKDLEAVSSEEQNAAKVPVAMNLGRNLAVAYNPEAHNWSIRKYAMYFLTQLGITSRASSSALSPI